MPIGYSDEHPGGELINRPLIFCDSCEQPIQDARDGNVYWFQNAQTALYFAHKRCALSYEHRLEAQGGYPPLSEELVAFLSHLLANVGMEAIE